MDRLGPGSRNRAGNLLSSHSSRPRAARSKCSGHHRLYGRALGVPGHEQRHRLDPHDGPYASGSGQDSVGAERLRRPAILDSPLRPVLWLCHATHWSGATIVVLHPVVVSGDLSGNPLCLLRHRPHARFGHSLHDGAYRDHRSYRLRPGPIVGTGAPQPWIGPDRDHRH